MTQDQLDAQAWSARRTWEEDTRVVSRLYSDLEAETEPGRISRLYAELSRMIEAASLSERAFNMAQWAAKLGPTKVGAVGLLAMVWSAVTGDPMPALAA